MVKYGVWFLGTDQESEGICYEGREPFVTDTKEKAEAYVKVLEYNTFEEHTGIYKVIKIEILD